MDPELHDILLEWEYAPGSNVPTLLNLTMVCPYVAPKVRLPEEARQPADASTQRTEEAALSPIVAGRSPVRIFDDRAA